MKTKDTTSTIVEFSKDKLNEGVQSTCDVMVDNVQLGLDKTNSPNLDQGVGYSNIEGRLDLSFKEKMTNIDENVIEMGEDAKIRAKDDRNSPMNFARRSYDDMKKKDDYYYHEGKDHIGENYEFVTDTIQDYYDEVGQHYRSAKDSYDRPTNHYKNRGGRHNYYKGPRDILSKSYYDVSKDEANDHYNDMKDKTTHAFNGVNHKAKNSYYNARDKMNGYIPNRHEEGSREYISMPRQKIANGYRNVHDKVEDYYKNAKFKPGKDLGAMVESMGWRRVGVVTQDHVPTASDDEVVIGNIKYEWHDKGQPSNHETISNHVPNSIKDIAHNMDEKVDVVKERDVRSAQNMQDIGIHAKDQAHDAPQAPRDDRSRVVRHSWTDHGSNYQEGDNDDDFITSKKIRNLKGRMRNKGHLYKSQRSKISEHTNLIEKDLLGFTQYDEDKKKLEEGRVLRLWKDIFLKRPEGIFLLLTRALHLFTFSTMYGSSFWVTFVSGLILSKYIPRQQFGYVQSRIFPVYLRILIVGQSVLFILHSILHPWFIEDGVERWELSNFGLMIASTLINAYVLEPQATKV